MSDASNDHESRITELEQGGGGTPIPGTTYSTGYSSCSSYIYDATRNISYLNFISTAVGTCTISGTIYVSSSSSFSAYNCSVVYRDPDGEDVTSVGYTIAKNQTSTSVSHTVPVIPGINKIWLNPDATNRTFTLSAHFSWSGANSSTIAVV